MYNKVLADLRAENERLRNDLNEQRNQCQQLATTIQQISADKTKLQRARDELARNLLAAENRAIEAEEALAAVSEQKSDALLTARQNNIASPHPSPSRKNLKIEEGATVDSLHHDLEILLDELDREREDRAILEETLVDTRIEAEKAAQQLVSAKKRTAELEKALKESKKGKSWLKRSTSPTSADQDATAEEEEREALNERITILKASRDKLIAALDAQAAESERLSHENVALADTLLELRKTAAAFEAQAQEGLIQGERLKDLLEESARWDTPVVSSATATPTTTPTTTTSMQNSAAAAGGGFKNSGKSTPTAIAGDRRVNGGGSSGNGIGDSSIADLDTAEALNEECRRLHSELLLQNSRCAELELQVRALCLELTRTASISLEGRRAMGPVLSGVESRLAATLGLKPVAT